MKKISPSLIGFIIAFIVGVISLVVYFQFIEKKSYYIIDNPTEASLNVQIDQKEYAVSPGQQVQIQLTKGEHTMNVQSQIDSLNFPQTSFKVDQLRGMINPTRSVYFIFGMPYGPTVNKDSIYTHLKADYQGKTYIGDVEIDSTIYNESFYYNLNEQFPTFTRKSDNSKLRKKIFRISDFKQFYFENFE